MIGFDEGAYGLAGIIVAALIAPTWLGWWNSRKTVRHAAQINRAVNHVPDGEPTLIERVVHLEAEVDQHRRWERSAFGALAHHVGCELPPHPDDL